MLNKIFYILGLMTIILSIFINHKVYGNSNVTVSNYEIIKEFQHKQSIKKRSKPLADYMYYRIRYYQGANNWYERHYMLLEMYEALQRME